MIGITSGGSHISTCTHHVNRNVLPPNTSRDDPEQLSVQDDDEFFGVPEQPDEAPEVQGGDYNIVDPMNGVATYGQCIACMMQWHYETLHA